MLWAHHLNLHTFNCDPRSRLFYLPDLLMLHDTFTHSHTWPCPRTRWCLRSWGLNQQPSGQWTLRPQLPLCQHITLFLIRPEETLTDAVRTEPRFNVRQKQGGQNKKRQRERNIRAEHVSVLHVQKHHLRVTCFYSLFFNQCNSSVVTWLPIFPWQSTFLVNMSVSPTTSHTRGLGSGQCYGGYLCQVR